MASLAARPAAARLPDDVLELVLDALVEDCSVVEDERTALASDEDEDRPEWHRYRWPTCPHDELTCMASLHELATCSLVNAAFRRVARPRLWRVHRARSPSLLGTTDCTQHVHLEQDDEGSAERTAALKIIWPDILPFVRTLHLHTAGSPDFLPVDGHLDHLCIALSHEADEADGGYEPP
jgi:hypothetical protein